MNPVAIPEVWIQDTAEANRDEVWSSLFDALHQIGGEWRKSHVKKRT